MGETTATSMQEYKEAKKAVYERKARLKKGPFLRDDFDRDLRFGGEPSSQLVDVVQVGSKVVIGAGVGLLAGVATVTMAASAAGVAVAGAVTKVAGVVGAAAGLSMGLNRYANGNKRKK